MGPFKSNGEALLRGSGTTGQGRKAGKQRADGIAAVLIDLFLPDSQGIETFDRLFDSAPQIPILVLSAAQDEDVAKWRCSMGRRIIS